MAAWLRSAPATYGYLCILVVTSWSLRGVSPHTADELIRAQSTNLDNLADRPLQVLVASAFWTSGSTLPWQLLIRFTLVMAPVERRLGTRRTVAVFAAGHVLATLLVGAGIDVGLRHHLLDLDLAHASDVGVSYGFYAVAGALTWLLVPRRWCVVWVAGLLASITVATLNEVTFTDVGHFVSLAIGLGTWPLVTRWQRFPVPRAPLGGRPIVVPRKLVQHVVRALAARRGPGHGGPTPRADASAGAPTAQSTD
ncbi:MAG TPA: rhomboid-like protein [Frankiaceae bacterium]|nr:rhomboid-like protein [Frankiaceae bacterium]